MTVLNQARPSSLSYQKSFSTRAICLGLGAADIVASKALRRICIDASLPGWLEGGGGPLANTSSQEHETVSHYVAASNSGSRKCFSKCLCSCQGGNPTFYR